MNVFKRMSFIHSDLRIFSLPHSFAVLHLYLLLYSISDTREGRTFYEMLSLATILLWLCIYEVFPGDSLPFQKWGQQTQPMGTQKYTNYLKKSSIAAALEQKVEPFFIRPKLTCQQSDCFLDFKGQKRGHRFALRGFSTVKSKLFALDSICKETKNWLTLEQWKKAAYVCSFFFLLYWFCILHQNTEKLRLLLKSTCTVMTRLISQLLVQIIYHLIFDQR